MTEATPPTEFDGFARSYTETLERGLSVSGETSAFFARARIEWLARCLDELDMSPRSVLDYGCGTGTSVPLFIELLKAESVIGLDVSQQSLEIARQAHKGLPARFLTPHRFTPSEEIDLAFCNGVFHHVLPGERRNVAAYISGALRPGGLFAFWENNPWNPGTRYVMSRIPFDREAVMLSSREAVTLLRSVGFSVVRVDYAFIFPRFLAPLRRVEPFLARFPLGAQYQIFCRKRAGVAHCHGDQAAL